MFIIISIKYHFYFAHYLILFCYSSPTITQDLIRDQKLMYNREVPIYGFITVDDSTAVYAGSNYIFLEVNLDPLNFGEAKVKANDTHCCILRLDPDQFTVGVIAEIIVANKLLAVQSMFGVDIVFYNQTQVSTSMPFIKIYFDSSWISYQQFTVCTPSSGCELTTYPYMLTFISNFYNFAAMHLQAITFNVTASAITVTDVPSIQDVQMTKYITNFTLYNSSSVYNFNNFGGPIQSFHQANQNLSFGSIFSITINTILIRNKEITSNYSDIFQMVDMEDMTPGTSFAGLVMVVGLQNLTFYAKYDGIWMDVVQVLPSTQASCVYFLNQIIDNYTIVLGSDCYNLQVQTPLITLTYNPNDNDPFNGTFSTMQLPLQLRSIATFLNGNTTQILGVQQGPSKSITGVLS